MKIVTAVIVFWAGLCHAAFVVGFGVSKLPAEIGKPMAGYGGMLDRIARGVHDDPEARALVIEKDSDRAVIVAMDLLIMRASLRDAVLARIANLGIDDSELMLTAIHTHSGPGGYVKGLIVTRCMGASYDPKMEAKLADAAALAIKQALAARSKARVSVGMSQLDLARNRSIKNGPKETALPIMKIDFFNRRRPVLVFAYGAHPVVLSGENRLYSADYVGAARKFIENQGADALFLAGPLGDQEPTIQDGKFWSKDVNEQYRQADEIGATLAKAVLEGAKTIHPVTTERVAVSNRREAPLPVRLRPFTKLWTLQATGAVKTLFHHEALFQTVVIGDALFVGVPAEPAAELGNEIRNGVPLGYVPFVLAHSNDWLGYALAEKDYRAGHYEGSLSFFGPEFGEWIVINATGTLPSSPQPGNLTSLTPIR